MKGDYAALAERFLEQIKAWWSEQHYTPNPLYGDALDDLVAVLIEEVKKA
jgi:hypothetical protein